MQLATDEARRRFASSDRAVLASVRPDGAPHLIPIVFALVDDVVHTAVDHKPKRSRRLQRVANLEHEPRCSLLVDHYAADWSRLWWVRADGRATVLEAAEVDAGARAALVDRHPAYQDRPPAGPWVRIEVTRWRGWAAS
jgi:PPOX class probable F420-dependent enzyme